MNALQLCLERHLAQASLAFTLDDELGTLHGLAWADFVLLSVLDAADGALPGEALAAKLGLGRSKMVLQLLPLEKLGLVQRAVQEDGQRRVRITGGGTRLLREARETAEAVCERAGTVLEGDVSFTLAP